MEDDRAGELALWRAASVDLNSGAFGRLFDLHRDAVFRQALRLVAQPADAEEVVAAAFFELWRKRSAVRVINESVLPWLLVTASNSARNSRRALLRQEALLRRIPLERDDDASRRAFERIDDGVVRLDLVRALRRLKAQDVVLLTMTALEGYSLSEVAALLGITENAASVRLHRVKARLRAVLAPTEDISAGREEVAR